MLLSVYAIYDTGVSTWLPPLYFRNNGECLRWFSEVVNNPESKLSKYPGDYSLFCLGTWDDDKCIFDLQKAPYRLAMGLDCFKPKVADFDKVDALAESKLS